MPAGGGPGCGAAAPPRVHRCVRRFATRTVDLREVSGDRVTFNYAPEVHCGEREEVGELAVAASSYLQNASGRRVWVLLASGRCHDDPGGPSGQPRPAVQMGH